MVEVMSVRILNKILVCENVAVVSIGCVCSISMNACG